MCMKRRGNWALMKLEWTLPLKTRGNKNGVSFSPAGLNMDLEDIAKIKSKYHYRVSLFIYNGLTADSHSRLH